MKLTFEAFSLRSGEPLLNSRRAIRQEIEEVFLQPRMSIDLLTRDQFIALAKADLLARGWQAPPPLVRPGSPAEPLDLRKDSVGLQIGLHSSTLLDDLLKLQAAHEQKNDPIGVGVYVVATAALQNHLSKQTNSPWTGLTFAEVSRKLPGLDRLLRLPLCLLGLHTTQIREPSRYQNINLMSPEQIKQTAFSFLEKRYSRPIDQNVRVMGMGRGADIEFDGVVHLDQTDLILEIVTSAPGVLPSRILADTTRHLSKTVDDYQRLTGHPAALRFVLLGEFSGTFLDRIRNQTGTSPHSPTIDYEVHRLEELGLTDRPV